MACMKKQILLLVFIFSRLLLPAQALVGTTGLLSLPSADMQEEGTVMAGGTCLHKRINPDVFNYLTYNYYFNATVLSFFEISFSKTLFKLKLHPDQEADHFNNADRSLSARVRLLKESSRLPALVIGMNDIYSQSNEEFMGDNDQSQYFGKMYLALRKSFRCKEMGILEGHLTYQYQSNYKHVLYKGWGAAVAFRPSVYPDLQLISEYDVSHHNWNNGFNVHLFRYLFGQVILQNGKYFSGGLALKIQLQPIN